jgi:hypothetical protein
VSDYKSIKTTEKVWLEMRSSHPEMIVFEGYSAPNGDFYGDPTKCRMETSYGFSGCDFPIIRARTTWDINPDANHERNNEKHEYWLCVGKDEVEA